MTEPTMTMQPEIEALSFTGPFMLRVIITVGDHDYKSPPLLLKSDNARDAIAEADVAVDGLWEQMREQVPMLRGIDVTDQREHPDTATLRFIKEAGADE